MKQAEDHLQLATKAKSYLKSQVAKAAKEVELEFTDKGLTVPPIYSSLPAISHSISIHYSFDFAQQVSLKN